jgi:hypothetical protein
MSEFNDPFSLHAQSRPSGHHTEDGREIRLIGNIHAFNPATNNASVPFLYRDHPLIRERYYYTLPGQVLDAIIEALGAEYFDSDLLTVERSLSAICRDHATMVGFWKDVVVSFHGLRAADATISSQTIQALDPAEAVSVENAVRVYRERDLGHLQRFRRGYVGWLLTNLQFLDEHDSLLANHAPFVQRWGTVHNLVIVDDEYRARLLPDTDPQEDPRWQPFYDDFIEFAMRWRLRRIAGPYLPEPLEPLAAGRVPVAILEKLMDANGIFFIPDTMPVSSRGHICGMLDDALHRGNRPEHLDEWLQIVRKDNTARNKMDRFARLFEIQHYWRILRDRHPQILPRNFQRIEGALAAIFKRSDGAVHSDMIEIRNRLGADWLEREWPL